MPDTRPELSSPATAPPSLLRAHLRIARVDHWIKNVLVLPGIVVAMSIDHSVLNAALPRRVVIGLLAVCLVTSSNYVLNEILDAPFDRAHPIKRLRPVPSGHVNMPLAYIEWVALLLAGVGLSLLISTPFLLTMLALWVMGCIYNIAPVRSKDLPYVDVLSEAINNPLRMLAGWYLTTTPLLPPASLLASYWMIGCYFMAIKRFAEYRDFNDSLQSASYRKSFAHYNEQKLLVSITFYGSCAMLFFGAFIMRYRLEFILAFPLIALLMAMYLSLAFKEQSAVQHPEALYREPKLMATIIACTVLMLILLFVDVPVLYHTFIPSAP
ncbi:MAG: UbiA prenyltransferase family protein [Blastocatellia bacterium]